MLYTTVLVQRFLGRPPIPMKLIWLIKHLRRENPLWGAPRSEKELTLLGHQVAKTSVSKYMIRFRKDTSLHRMRRR